MKYDIEIRRYFRELYNLCDNYFDNTNEQRIVSYIIEKLEKINNHVSTHYEYDSTLKEFIIQIPKFDNEHLDLLPRSRKEKLITFLFFFFTIPFALSKTIYSDMNYLDSWKENTVFNDKQREKARNEIIKTVSIVSNLSIDMLNKIK